MLGRVVNNYEIQALIGEGGQGSVYLAQHPFIGRKAAVKVMRRSFAEDDVLVARFMNEALAANAIGHPNIIDIIDVGRLEDGLPYLMMEYLDGETLGARLRRQGKLAVDEALAITEQTAAALGAAHAKGIVHRDLKPENVFLARDGAGVERLKLLDFGIAKLRRERTPNKIETDGALFGTPVYMSPEQCRGMSGEADGRSDIYGLATIVFEMICGRPPFVADAHGDILIAHVTQPPPDPRSFTPELGEALATVILRALAKSPAERYPTMEAFWAAVRWAAPFYTPAAPEPRPPAPPAPEPAPTASVWAVTTARVRRLWDAGWSRAALSGGLALLAVLAWWLLRPSGSGAVVTPTAAARAPRAPVATPAVPAAITAPAVPAATSTPSTAAAAPVVPPGAASPPTAAPGRKSVAARRDPAAPSAKPAERRLIVIPEKPPLSSTPADAPARPARGIKKW